MNPAHQKVTASHLSRDAYLYVRQSTLRQMIDHGESTRRQYALRERAVALGWPTESIVVIDSDQGLSGADRDREGFQRLVAEVGMGRAGIVLGLEVSRLARNSTERHRLLEICALSETLILDEDGVYDPGDFNDRLLLGLLCHAPHYIPYVVQPAMSGSTRNLLPERVLSPSCPTLDLPFRLPSAVQAGRPVPSIAVRLRRHRGRWISSPLPSL